MTPVFTKLLQIGRRTSKRRRRINPVSDSRRLENARRNSLRLAWMHYRPGCEVRGTGVPCGGVMTIHEPWTRARRGPIDDPRNFVTACAYHNWWLSQTAGGIAWGAVHGLLYHEWDGRPWLEKGGRFPGMTRDEAVAFLEAA